MLPSQAKFQLAKTKLKAQLLVVMVGALSIWLAASVAIWVWWIVNNQVLKKTKSNYDSVLTEYNKRQDDLFTSQKLKYQAKMVGKVLASRFEYGEAITNINSLLPSDIQIENFKIAGKNAFTINYTTAKGENMDVLEEKINEIGSKKVKGFVAADLKSLLLDKGIWKFSMEVKTE